MREIRKSNAFLAAKAKLNLKQKQHLAAVVDSLLSNPQQGIPNSKIPHYWHLPYEDPSGRMFLTYSFKETNLYLIHLAVISYKI